MIVCGCYGYSCIPNKCRRDWEGSVLAKSKCVFFPKTAFVFHESSTAFSDLSFVSLKNRRVLDLLQNEFLWTFSLSDISGPPGPGRGSRGTGGV